MEEEFERGERVRFKKASVANEYTVLRSFRNVHQEYIYDLEGPHRNRYGVAHTKLESVPKKSRSKQ